MTGKTQEWRKRDVRSTVDRELSQFEHQLLDHLTALSDFHGKVFLAHAQESLAKLAAQRGV